MTCWIISLASFVSASEVSKPEIKKVIVITEVTPEENILFSPIAPLQKVDVFKIEHPKKEQHKNWSNDIAELENYFASITYPTQPIKLDSFMTVSNFETFVDVNLETVKANLKNPTFLPYLDRLKLLRQSIEKGIG